MSDATVFEPLSKEEKRKYSGMATGFRPKPCFLWVKTTTNLMY